MGEEEFPAMMYRNIRITESLRLQQKEQKTLLVEFITRSKDTFKSLFAEYLADRNSIFGDLKNQGDKFRAIVELLSAEKPNEEELTKQIESYSTNYRESEFKFIAKKATDNIKITLLADKITACLTTLEVEELGKVMSEVKESRAEL